ncbi:hypothetical protein BD324DRAFT_617267 [Kockovaella imperatae]|uniref:Uncharacterized protein n=1 Tax=Kockovaella imperatae TaxID=4999 RepID=A0A1Y1UQP7_9TREE|nr:hypothetical protein BD324DRAFT_617267 [Kockovaella imperatae]ORX40309.1 hypothetical protein BD324DRAFT_617267 [Kockovaella imperatae]
MKFFVVVALALISAVVADYGDCRDTGCPGGQCVSSNSSDPSAGYICEFPPASSSPAAATTSAVINDCRTSSTGCPGGYCVASDSSDPNAAYVCSFTITPQQTPAVQAGVSSNGKAPTTINVGGAVAATTTTPATIATKTSGSNSGGNAAGNAGAAGSSNAVASIDQATIPSVAAAVKTGAALATTSTGQGLFWGLVVAVFALA